MIRLEGNYLARTPRSVINVRIARVGTDRICITGELNGRIEFRFNMSEQDYCKIGNYFQATKED